MTIARRKLSEVELPSASSVVLVCRRRPATAITRGTSRHILQYGRPEEGRTHNGLVIRWPDLERLAANVKPQAAPPSQGRLS
jgi:hypothetical protein